MNYPYAKTGNRIWQLRKSKHLTREQLAEKADISVQFLFEIERGKKNMTVTTLRKIASALGVMADFIINGDETEYDLSDRELITAYKKLSPEKQYYAMQILRVLSEDVK